MDELSRAARAVLELAQDGHDPTAAQRMRADAAVRIGLALNGLTDLPPLGPPVHAPHLAAPPTHPSQHAAPAPAASSALSALSGTGTWKLGVVGGALLFAGVFAARSAWPAPGPAQPAQPVSTAPAAVPAVAIGSTTAPVPAAGVVEASTPIAAASPRRESAPNHALASTHMRSTRSRAPRAQLATAAATDADLQAEVALIGAADELIRAQRYDAALRVLASHARRFPRGALREERDALRLLSLCGNGLDARSERAVQRFLRSEPHSVVAQRMREACVPGESS